MEESCLGCETAPSPRPRPRQVSSADATAAAEQALVVSLHTYWVSAPGQRERQGRRVVCLGSLKGPGAIRGPSDMVSQRLTLPVCPSPLVGRGQSGSRWWLTSGEGGPDSADHFTSLFSTFSTSWFPMLSCDVPSPTDRPQQGAGVSTVSGEVARGGASWGSETLAFAQKRLHPCTPAVSSHSY